ncbi:hypothetical protein GBA52_018656 [Prunus armeniaca]|nr:hypothetical protein GBA52_018656 [Prunus armeniaca]
MKHTLTMDMRSNPVVPALNAPNATTLQHHKSCAKCTPSSIKTQSKYNLRATLLLSRTIPSRKRKQESTLPREQEHGHEYEHKHEHEHEHERKNKKTTMRVVRIHVWDPYATDDSSGDDENSLE